EPLHAPSRVEAGKAAETVRMTGADLCHSLVGNLIRTCHAQVAAAHGSEKGFLDAGLVHATQIFVDLHPTAISLGHSDLCLECVVEAGLVVVDFGWRVEIANNINSLRQVRSPGSRGGTCTFGGAGSTDENLALGKIF